MNVYSVFKRTQARKIPSSLSLSFKGIPEPRSGEKLARLIDPAVNLLDDRLICQPIISHFLAEPNSHSLDRFRNLVRSSDAYHTPTPMLRQPPFLYFFHFFLKPLILLAFLGF